MKKITLLTLLIMFFNLSAAQTALDFDPLSGAQQVEITGITCPSELTIEVWINYRGNSGNYPTILEFQDDAPFFGITDSDFITLFGAVTSTTTIPLNQWTHVAVTYSTTNSEANIYINGVLDNSETGVSINISGVGAGIGFNTIDEVFNGSIDDVRIWNAVRTDLEISANINTCLVGNETNLYAFYNFDEGSGTTVNDLTSNGFDGTLVNMDPSTDWITFDSCNTLSIDNPNRNLQISLFPNPASDLISIQGLKNRTDYVMYNAIGAKVLAGTIGANENVDIQSLTTGIYLLKLEGGNTLKFIKK